MAALNVLSLCAFGFVVTVNVTSVVFKKKLLQCHCSMTVCVFFSGHTCLSLTLGQHCLIGVFIIGRKLSRLLKHGRSCSIAPRGSNESLFYIWQMTSYKTVGVKEVNLFMSSGRSSLVLSRLFLRMVMTMERMWPPDW